MAIENIDILKPDGGPPDHYTKEDARVKWGMHDCIHSDEVGAHICGCDKGEDHEALNP